MFSLSRHNIDRGCFIGEDSVSKDPGLSHTLTGLRASESLGWPVIESPAKIFARMKARVQLDRSPVEDSWSPAQKSLREEQVRSLNLSRKICNPWLNCEQKENKTCEYEHEGLTLSPVKSPRKRLTRTHFDFHTPQKILDAVNVAQSPRGIFSRLKENNAALSPGKLSTKALTNHWQPLPLNEMGSRACIPANIDIEEKDPAVEGLAFSIQAPQKAFSHPLAQGKLTRAGKQAPPKVFECGNRDTNRSKPVSGSNSTDCCNERGQEELEDDCCLDPTNRGGARVRCASTPACAPRGAKGDASAMEAFRVPAVTTDPPETSSPASPEAGPSSDEPSPPPSPRGLPGLAHDPLLRLTPKISIPKKRPAVFRAKPVVQSGAPSTTKNHLQDWVLMRRGSSLYVKGFHMNNKMPWQSNLITERLSSNTLKTTSGSTYVLVGPMALEHGETEFPKSMLKKFLFGFPKNWKECVKGLFLEPEVSESDKNYAGNGNSPTPQNPISKRSSSTSQKPKPKRPVSCSATSEAGGAKVSRSGRLLKPPLEYWKGARVILDCDLNVTVHEGYDTFSVPNSQQRKTLARVVSQGPLKPATVFFPPGEGLLQEATSLEDTVPLRKVRAYHRPPKTKPAENAPNTSEMPGWPPTSMPVPSDAKAPTGPGRPLRAGLASPRSKAEAVRSAQHPGPPSVPGPRLQGKATTAQQPPIPPRRSHRSTKTRSGSDDTDTESSELLPRKPTRGHGKAGRPGVIGLPPEGVSQRKPAERTMAGRHTVPNGAATTRLRGQNPGGGGGSVTEDDGGARKERPKAVAAKSGSEMPFGLRKRGRVLENSNSSASLSSPDDLKRELSKRESGSDDQKKGSRARGRLLGDSMTPSTRWATSLEDSQPDADDDEDNVAQKKRTKKQADKSETVNTHLTRTRGRVSKGSVAASRGLLTSSDNSKTALSKRECTADWTDVGQTTQAKARAVKSEPVKPRNRRARGRVVEGSMGASTFSDNDEPIRACPEKRRGKDSRYTSTQQGKIKENQDRWTEEELLRLHEAVTSIPKHVKDFWVKVASVVGSRSAEECQEQHNAQVPACPRPRGAPKTKKAPPVTGPPQITARKGTLKRKQQVRNLLDHMPKDAHDDIFNSSPMQNKRVKLPSVSPNGAEDVFMRSEHHPQTPGSSAIPSAKTPQCLHITPGMMGSVNRNDDDKYIFQLQKRMKRSQAKLHKIGAAPKYTTTPSAKSALRRCDMGSDSSMLVWKMFEAKGDLSLDSGEEEDYYFGEED